MWLRVLMWLAGEVCAAVWCVHMLVLCVCQCAEVQCGCVERAYLQLGPWIQEKAPGLFSCSLMASGGGHLRYSKDLRLAQGRGCACVLQRMLQQGLCLGFSRKVFFSTAPFFYE